MSVIRFRFKGLIVSWYIQMFILMFKTFFYICKSSVVVVLHLNLTTDLQGSIKHQLDGVSQMPKAINSKNSIRRTPYNIIYNITYNI